jgi:hypothetical protein
MVGTLCLLSATNASAALSGTFNASDSTTGNTVVTGFTSGPFTVGVSGPSFCLGPPNACGSGSGVTASTSVSGTQVTFTFFGSTAGAGPGSFTVNLTGFSSAITAVSLTSGGLGGATITDSHTSNSLSFTFTAGSDYNALGGNTAVFNVTSAAVPEPSSVVLLSTFLAGAVFIGRRRLLVRGSRA